MSFETNSPVSRRSWRPERKEGCSLCGPGSGELARSLRNEYLRYNENGVLEVEKKPGCLGMEQFRKIVGHVAEFTTISPWSSMEAMEQPRTAKIICARRTWRRTTDLLEVSPEYVEVSELHANHWLVSPDELP